MRHAGDFGNLEADASGKAHYERVDATSPSNGADSIIGRGVIVHEKADDLKTQPTAMPAARVACGASACETVGRWLVESGARPPDVMAFRLRLCHRRGEFVCV